MAKLKALKGVVYNLADSIMSPTNHAFVTDFSSSKYTVMKVDVLKGRTVPKSIKVKDVKKVVSHYKHWFSNELKKLDIYAKEIKSASVRVVKKENAYTSMAKIEAKDKLTNKVRVYSSSSIHMYN